MCTRLRWGLLEAPLTSSLSIGVAANFFLLAFRQPRYDLRALSPGKVILMSVERRRASRIPFDAAAEIIDGADNTRSASQVSDLSLHGCFVQLPNPFPEGTPVTVEIYKDEDFLETPATVVCYMPKRGMGLTFNGMEPQFASVLKKWLTQSKTTVRHA